jgi:hypothetical protein
MVTFARRITKFRGPRPRGLGHLNQRGARAPQPAQGSGGSAGVGAQAVEDLRQGMNTIFAASSRFFWKVS